MYWLVRVCLCNIYGVDVVVVIVFWWLLLFVSLPFSIQLLFFVFIKIELMNKIRETRRVGVKFVFFEINIFPSSQECAEPKEWPDGRMQGGETVKLCIHYGRYRWRIQMIDLWIFNGNWFINVDWKKCANRILPT